MFIFQGLSLQIFKKWCTDEKNMIIMPGYCVAGTVGKLKINIICKFCFWIWLLNLILFRV